MIARVTNIAYIVPYLYLYISYPIKITPANGVCNRNIKTTQLIENALVPMYILQSTTFPAQTIIILAATAHESQVVLQANTKIFRFIAWKHKYGTSPRNFKSIPQLLKEGGLLSYK